ncbi:hypothetical protein, partial [Consotaella aegiceratis]|uniref:hypothetical protein n=1 Tax=Consotaella aegiceratis TaxID=3097961 RepID=UPI002F3F3DFC
MSVEPEKPPQSTDPTGDLLAVLRPTIANPARRVVVAVDGAGIGELDGKLSALDLRARPLYHGSSSALVKAGPYTIDLYAPAAPEAATPEPEPAADLSDEALAAEADRLAETMRQALEAGDKTGGGVLSAPQEEANDTHEGTLREVDPGAAAKRLEALVGLVGASPFVVFWIGGSDLTEDRLHRHLRTLNKVLIPAGWGEDNGLSALGGAAGDDPKELASPVQNETVGGTAPQEAVLFRHADGNVLAQVLPCLDGARLARVFGPARAILFVSPDYPAASGRILHRALRPDDLPPPRPGMLTLDVSVLRAVEARRLERMKPDFIAYLRRQAGARVAHVPDERLGQEITAWMRSGYANGLRTEAGRPAPAHHGVRQGSLAVRPDELPEQTALFVSGHRFQYNRI